ncbi:MAG: hypothetical protein CM15mP120_00860 [Pseudomonadota bacterium]|nr:MAG: hypothetical protein CM15mP120_00860 [Pseudomonadota bacterium]
MIADLVEDAEVRTNKRSEGVFLPQLRSFAKPLRVSAWWRRAYYLPLPSS